MNFKWSKKQVGSIFKNLKNLFLLPALIAGLGLIPAGRVTAQTFTTLHSFTATSHDSSTQAYINREGAGPQAGLILSNDTLYGTAAGGGSSGNGTVFALSTDGTGFTNLHSFTGGGDGASPLAELILSDNTLYGTTVVGGNSGYGTVFAVNINGTGFTLHNFTGGSDRAYPQAGLILSGNTLYGTTVNVNGTVFSVSTDGTGFTNLHTFTGVNYSGTNSDGANPVAGLILSGDTLYGTAVVGGGSGNGTVFSVNTNGTDFTTLHSFTATSPGTPTNGDGANPNSGLSLSGGRLYGTAKHGGPSGNGTVFSVSTDGTGFTNLHSFTAFSNSPPYTNNDGGLPNADLVVSGQILYGTAIAGGSSGNGTVFKVNTDGTSFTTLHKFTASSYDGFHATSTNSDGFHPNGLSLSRNTLYGTTANGGTGGNGTVFSLFIPPQLTMLPSGTSVILTWPTNAAGFSLQSTTNLVSPVVWTTVSTGPVIVNGQNVVTNPISSSQEFYRLSQ